MDKDVFFGINSIYESMSAFHVELFHGTGDLGGYHFCYGDSAYNLVVGRGRQSAPFHHPWAISHGGEN